MSEPKQIFSVRKLSNIFRIDSEDCQRELFHLHQKPVMLIDEVEYFDLNSFEHLATALRIDGKGIYAKGATSDEKDGLK